MKRWFWTAGLGLLALSGCGKFFVSQNTSGSGSGTGNTTAGDVLYVANLTSSTVTGYTVSTAGALTAVSGSPYTPSGPPTSMAITPGNTFLYVGTDTGIVAYSIGTNGVLTQLNSGAALVSDLTAPTSMQVDTTGAYLLAAGINLASGTGAPAVGVYAIDTSTGGLTAQPNSPLAVAAGNAASTATPGQLYIAPNDADVYLTFGTGGTEILNFTSSDGGLSDTATHINLSSKGLSQSQVLANSTSTVLYVTETGAGIRAFSIGTSGALTEISGSPFATGTGPSGMVLSAAGTNLYVANKGDGTISGYAVAAAGTVGSLTVLASSPYTAGSQPLSLSLDQSNTFLAVANSQGNPDLGVYSFDPSVGGKLDAVSNETASTVAGAFLVVSTH